MVSQVVSDEANEPCSLTLSSKPQKAHCILQGPQVKNIATEIRNSIDT